MPDIRTAVIIGKGTIGRAVADALRAGAVPGRGLVGHRVRNGAADVGAGTFHRIEDALAAAPSVVVEAASHEAVREYAVAVVASGADFVCASVGALADEALRGRIEAGSRDGGGRLLIPSGAVGALDLLRAAAVAGLDEVLVEQRKPPATLLPEDEARSLAAARTVFDGSVGDVVALYPKTTNVAAAVALAGLGFDGTRARVVADPALRANRAVVEAHGAFGSFTLQLDNVATANPRTSAITAASIVATLRRLADPLVVPA